MERSYHQWATESILDIHTLNALHNTCSHQAEHPQNTESKIPEHPNLRVKSLLQLNPLNLTLSRRGRKKKGRKILVWGTRCQRQPEKHPLRQVFPALWLILHSLEVHQEGAQRSPYASSVMRRGQPEHCEESASPLLRKQMEPQRGHGLEEASVSLSDSHNNYFNQILSAQICEVERNGPSRIMGTGSLSPTYPDS